VHDYAERRVRLDVWLVERYEGEPSALEQQELRWLAPEELALIDLLPADRPIVDALLARARARR
jgi:8-oxo-dGTP diphosphatase